MQTAGCLLTIQKTHSDYLCTYLQRCCTSRLLTARFQAAQRLLIARGLDGKPDAVVLGRGTVDGVERAGGLALKCML